MTLPPPPARAAEAMRYYRVWIYACNGALLLGALVFLGAFGRALTDYRRSLVPGISPIHPGFLYGYAAIPAQAGLIQLLGCLAAVRLSEKLLNAYWLALLALLIGDVAIGVFWAFKFERVCKDLKPNVKIKLVKDYSVDLEFAEAWDRLQREQRCCGATGPSDFGDFNRTSWPMSCCKSPQPLTSTASATRSNCTPYSKPCSERLLEWVKKSADALFVLGYCVLTFLKLCFVGILRYEIKEMIQKIRILRTELDAEELGEEGGFLSGGGPLSQTVIVNTVNANGGVRGRDSPDRGGERDALLGGRIPTEESKDSGRDVSASSRTLSGSNNCELRELARGDYRRLPLESAESAATRI